MAFCTSEMEIPYIDDKIKEQSLASVQLLIVNLLINPMNVLPVLFQPAYNLGQEETEGVFSSLLLLLITSPNFRSPIVGEKEKMVGVAEAAPHFLSLRKEPNFSSKKA